MSARFLEVLEPGLLTSVQDAGGRIGWRRYGVPTCGAADPWSARLANRLVGNADEAAVLEVTLLGPALRFEGAALVGLAGADLGAELDGRPLPPGRAARVRDGAVLRFEGPRQGARAYVAVDGGIEVKSLLGSRSTDLRSGFGGLEGRALQAGDRVPLGEAPRRATPRRALALQPSTGPLRVLPGPHRDRFAADALEQLCVSDWIVSPQADRAGVRFDGPALRHADSAEVASVGLPVGAVQVPPDGRPIAMLADRPVTGGYVVLACVIRADIGRLAQLVAGDEACFELVIPAEAGAALEAEELRLTRLEPMEDSASSWAGAHE